MKLFRAKQSFTLTSKLVKAKQGFTLIELLVVISIISILSAFLMANFIGVRQRGRDALRKSDLKQIQSALELYRADNGKYPGFQGGFAYGWFTPTKLSGISPNYMQTPPSDPTAQDTCPYTTAPSPYLVSIDSTNSKYTIFAYLENQNDADATKSKTPPSAPPNGEVNPPSSTTYKVNAGTCHDSTYNFWVNNP